MSVLSETRTRADSISSRPIPRSEDSLIRGHLDKLVIEEADRSSHTSYHLSSSGDSGKTSPGANHRKRKFSVSYIGMLTMPP